MKIRKLYQSFNNCKLATKMFLTFILGAILPILLTQVLFYEQSLRFMTQKVNELTTNNLIQIAERTDLTMEVYTNLLYQMYVDEDISKNINILMDEGSGGKAAAYNHLFNRLRQYNIGERGVRCISIICGDGTAITYDYQTGSSLDTLWREYKNMCAIQPYKDAKDKIGMVISPTMKFQNHGKEAYFFHISKRIFDLNDLEKGSIATIVMSVDAQVLNDICTPEMNQDTQEVYGITFIVDGNRQIIAYPNEMFMGITLDEKLTMEKLVQLSGLLKHKQNVINKYEDTKTGWTFYSVYDKDYMLRDMKKVQWMFIWIGITVVFFAGLLIIAMVRKILHAVAGVIQGMNQVKGGNLDVVVPVENEDEIGQIAHNFNDMTSEVKSLVTEVKHATDRQKNAEIKALEAQINPHFLYNTLDSINWMAIEKGEYEISNMLRNLGVILRYSVNKSNQMVTVREAADWMEKYVSLQKVRFNNAFECKLTIEERVMNKKLYKLLIQPFLENAIIHGFSGIEQGGLLRIDFIQEDEDETICIIIEDNGVGMPQDKITIYNDRKLAIQEEEEHIGLHNAFARIHMYYGERGKWNITSMEGMGTVVTLKIPWRV